VLREICTSKNDMLADKALEVLQIYFDDDSDDDFLLEERDGGTEEEYNMVA